MFPASRILRFAILIAVIGIGVGQYQVQARVAHQVSTFAQSSQSADVLVWQGKLLPIVTDVYSSLGDLSTALTNRDVDGVAKVGDQFASERQRFEVIAPTPSSARAIARVIDSGLRNLSNGTKALVVGLRASDNTASQRAANQVVQGDRQFQQAVDLIRRAAGPLIPSNNPTGKSTPVPTPIIRGLP